MAQKNKQAPFGTQSSADAQRSEMFEASVLKSASMEAQQIVQEGEKEARQIVEQARHSSVDTQLDAYRRAAKRAAALEAAVARRENRDRLLRYRTQLVNGLFAEAQEAALAFAQSGQAYAAFVQAALARHRDACAQGPCRVLVRTDFDALAARCRPAGLQVRAVRRRRHCWAAPNLRAATCCLTRRWTTALPRCARNFWAVAACVCSKGRAKHATGRSRRSKP
ncbi:MAG: hypothetical protein ACLRWF_04325 [Ruthenibacterium sp.]